MIQPNTESGGPGFRATPPARIGGVLLALLLVIVACAAEQSGESVAPPAAPAASGSVEAGSSRADTGATGGASEDGENPVRIGEIGLQLYGYDVGEALAAEGAGQLRAMLHDLDLEPGDVSLAIGIDRPRSLAVSRWGVPGRSATQILDAWLLAAGEGWARTTIGSTAAVTGRGPDGSRAWAVAEDGVLVYIAAPDASTAATVITEMH